MTIQMHSAIPSMFREHLDDLLVETKEDLGFDEFDEKNSFQAYQVLQVIYFFELGSNLYEQGIDTNEVSEGLMKYLQSPSIEVSIPKSYEDLKTIFENLNLETSKYLASIN